MSLLTICSKLTFTSIFDLFIEISRAGNWKFSFAVEGWTWNDTHAGPYMLNSYVSAGVQIGFSSKKSVSVEFYNTTRTNAIAATFGSTTLELSMDLGVILDGEPALSVHVMQFPNLSFPAPTNFFAVWMPLFFCEPTPSGSYPLRRWNSMFNDPSIQVIFADLAPNAPLSPQERKSKKIVTIIAPIVAASVVLVIVAIVLLVIFNRRVRNLVLPHNAERVKEARDTSRQTRSSWIAASKPALD